MNAMVSTVTLHHGPFIKSYFFQVKAALEKQYRKKKSTDAQPVTSFPQRQTCEWLEAGEQVGSLE